MLSHTEEELKVMAVKGNQGGCNDLLKHMSDLKWTRQHENVMEIKDINKVCELEKENCIVVFPERKKMNEAIGWYSMKNRICVENLDCNNNGVLDGFIDHKKNMFLLNEEYTQGRQYATNCSEPTNQMTSDGLTSHTQTLVQHCSGSWKGTYLNHQTQDKCLMITIEGLFSGAQLRKYLRT